MKKLNLMKIASLAIALFATTSLFAQGIKDIRINEVLVKNTLSIVNGVGEKGGWVELVNTGYAAVDLGGCTFAKVTPSGEVTHVIPKGLSTTSIPSQNYILIHLGALEVSPLTTNFDIEDATELRIYDTSGKNLIDRVVINQSMVRENVSLGRPAVDLSTLRGRRDNADIDIRSTSLVVTERLTPGYSNFPVSKESRAEAFRRVDNTGAGMAIIAMSVVFLALLALFGVFAQVGKYMQYLSRKKDAKANPVQSSSSSSASVAPASSDLSGETLAAIGIAIKMYEDELNASEARVLTINRTVRAYSPWSSKIYGLTQLPNRK